MRQHIQDAALVVGTALLVALVVDQWYRLRQYKVRELQELQRNLRDAEFWAIVKGPNAQ